MKIKFLKDVIATEDGFTNKSFQKGSIYEVVNRLAETLIKTNFAVEYLGSERNIFNPVKESKVIEDIKNNDNINLETGEDNVIENKEKNESVLDKILSKKKKHKNKK